MDSLLAVKQPLSEIQPKTTETFQDGELGSMHPSLHGTSWHHLMSTAATTLKGAQYETFM